MNLEGVDDAFVLSPTQLGMLYHCLESGRPDTYVSAIQLRMEGNLDVERWQLAWRQVVQRHEALRACFIWDGLDIPLQVIQNDVQLPWSIAHIDHLEPSAQQHTKTDVAAPLVGRIPAPVSRAAIG